MYIVSDGHVNLSPIEKRLDALEKCLNEIKLTIAKMSIPNEKKDEKCPPLPTN